MKRYVLFSIIQPVEPKIYKTLKTAKTHTEKNINLIYKEFKFPEEANLFAQNIKKNNSILAASIKPAKNKNNPDQEQPQSLGHVFNEERLQKLKKSQFGETVFKDFMPSALRQLIKPKETYTGFFDGSSKGNPGRSGFGYYITDSSFKRVLDNCGYLGIATNNFAEFRGLTWLLADAYCNGINILTVYGDSQLVIKGSLEEYEIRAHKLIPEKEAAVFMRSKFSQIVLRRVSRQSNTFADKLANQGVKKRVIIVQES